MISVLGSLMSVFAGLRSEHDGGCGGDTRPSYPRLDLDAVRRVRAERRDLEPYLEAAGNGGGKAPVRSVRGRSRPAAGDGCKVIRFRKRA